MAKLTGNKVIDDIYAPFWEKADKLEKDLDEYGKKLQTQREQANRRKQEIVDQYSQAFRSPSKIKDQQNNPNVTGRVAGTTAKKTGVKDQQNNPNVTGRVASTKKAVKKTWDPDAVLKSRREQAAKKKGR